MSQQHTTQASGQEMLEHVLEPREHDAAARTEVIAGFITFLTMVYTVSVNPQILGVASMDTSAIFVTTCLAVTFGSIMMRLSIDLSAVLVPAMDLSAFFAFMVMQVMGLSWQVRMNAISWGAIGLLLLMIFRVRCWTIANIPASLRVGITSGIGLFIGMIGLKSAGVAVVNPKTLVSIGDLISHGVLLGILGFFIITILTSRNIHAAVLVSIVVTTPLGRTLGDAHYNGIVSALPSVMTVVGHVDLAGPSNLGLVEVIFFFILVNLFDSSGILIGMTDKAGLADEKGKFPCMKQALYVDNISSMTGPFVGTSSVTVYVESSSDVSVGGRTGLTAVAVGLLFLLVIFLSPLAGMAPGYAATGALIYIGVLVTSSLARVSWQDLAESIPAFIIVVMISFSFSITEGIALGFISYCVMKTGTGRLRDLSSCVTTVALLFTLKIISIGAH